MSKHETPMTRWYWQQVGGTLIEEFCAVRGSRSCGVRLLDGVIVKGGPFVIARKADVRHLFRRSLCGGSNPDQSSRLHWC